MGGGQPGLAQLALETEVEVGGVDADHDIGSPGQRIAPELAAHADQPGQVTEHLDQPHHREGLQGKAAVDALLDHARPADAAELDAGMTGLEGTHQAGAEDIPGELAGHQVDALHGGALVDGHD